MWLNAHRKKNPIKYSMSKMLTLSYTCQPKVAAKSTVVGRKSQNSEHKLR